MTIEMSRSELKRRVKQLEQLVSELSKLPATLIDRLPCHKEIRSLFHEASTMKGGARKRHIKYLTKLLKNEPIEPLYAFLSDRKGNALQEQKEFHEVEYMRDALLNEAIEREEIARQHQESLEEDWTSSIANEINAKYSGIDKKQLTRLAWLYMKTRNRKHSRELFRIIRSAQENELLQSRNE